MEVSANSVEPPETERDFKKMNVHKDGSIGQQYWTSYTRNNEFVTRMEGLANSAEPPEVEMDLDLFHGHWKNHAFFYLSTSWSIKHAEPFAAEKE